MRYTLIKIDQKNRDFPMIFNKKRVLLFALVALIAIQPLAVQANQSANNAFSFTSLYNSFKSAWNDSGDWKNYAGLLATAVGLYTVYRWATSKSAKPQGQPEKAPIDQAPSVNPQQVIQAGKPVGEEKKSDVRQVFKVQSDISIDAYIKQYLLENQKALKDASSQENETQFKGLITQLINDLKIKYKNNNFSALKDKIKSGFNQTKIGVSKDFGDKAIEKAFAEMNKPQQAPLSQIPQPQLRIQHAETPQSFQVVPRSRPDEHKTQGLIQPVVSAQSTVIEQEQPKAPTVSTFAQSPAVLPEPSIQVPKNLPQRSRQKTKIELSREDANALIQKHVGDWVVKNRDSMNGVFLCHTKYDENKGAANTYGYLEGQIDEEKTKKLFLGLVEELQELWDSSDIDYSLISEEVYDNIRTALGDLGFRGNTDSCQWVVFRLIASIVEQHWKPKIDEPILPGPVQEKNPQKSIEQENFEDPVLTEEEKKYLELQLSYFQDHPLDMLKFEKNKKRSDDQDDILGVGNESIRVIFQILKDGDNAPKGLLKKAVGTFVNALQSATHGYYSLKKILIDDADKKKLEEINWGDEEQVELKAYCSNLYRFKKSRACSWIMKVASISNEGLFAGTAQSACRKLQILQQNDKRLEKDLALKQAIEISCTRATIEQESWKMLR